MTHPRDLAAKTALSCLMTLVLISPAFAGGRASPVAGKFAHIEGVTKERKTFGARSRRDDHMDIAFGEDNTFNAFAVSGSYTQNGKKLRFEVAESRLRDFERSWEAAYEARLRSDGLAPESVECEIRKAKLKGRSKRGKVKFKSTYKIRCRANGPFGAEAASGRVRFRGKGLLVDGVLGGPLPGPPGPPGPLFEDRPGTGGAVVEIVERPPAELVLRDNTFDLDPGAEREPRESIEAGGGVRIRVEAGDVTLIVTN